MLAGDLLEARLDFFPMSRLAFLSFHQAICEHATGNPACDFSPP
jgi:hypothetical protein